MHRACAVVVGCVVVAFAAVVVVAPPATAWDREWVRDVRRTVGGVAIDDLGNTYVSGYSDCYMQTILPTCEGYLMKFGPAGGLRWKRVWKPQDAHFTRGIDVAVDGDGTAYWAGEVAANDDFGPSSWFLRAVGPNGRLLWHREQPWRTEFHRTYVTDVATGGGVVALSAYDECWECDDAWWFPQDARVVAHSTGGRFLWERAFEPLGDVPVGYSERATGVAVSALGNVYVAGWAARGPDDGGKARTGTIAVSKLSDAGTRIWTTRVLSVRDSAAGASAQVTCRADRVMVSATSRASFSGLDPKAWLGRLTPGGSLVWSRTWGRERAGAEPTEVALDGSLRTWVVGTHRSRVGGDFRVFVRAYATHGTLLRSVSLASTVFAGGGISATGDALSFTGRVDPRHARIWRYSI